jgi:lysophospholipase
MDRAPFFADLAEGPAGGEAYWLTAEDGVRVRVATWAEGSKGTVFILPGRTEYCEKYGRAAGELADRGFSSLAIDYRGQGLADRLLPDRLMGHVDRFPDYQHDIREALFLAGEKSLPKPYFMIAHSMGGAIGLRTIMGLHPFRAALFSAPMWRINIAKHLRPVAWALNPLARATGLGNRYAPTTGPAPYTTSEPFDDNMLTRDKDMWAYMGRQITAQPDLALGGPSMHWLAEAMVELRHLRLARRPNLPVITALGSNERIVEPERIHEIMGTWVTGTLDLYDGAEHEIMMETLPHRRRFFDSAAAFFDVNA